MRFYRPINTEIFVIVHGKSEYELVTYIKSNLRIKIEIISNNKGKNSIQINSLMNIFQNTILKSKKNFIKEYTDIDLDKKRNPRNLYIFPIMDTDDCSLEKFKTYKNKSMFMNHWLYNFIIPIYNKNNLEDVLKKSNIPYERKAKQQYVKIFPTNRGQADIQQIMEFGKKIESTSDISNLHLFINKCIEIQKNYPTF